MASERINHRTFCHLEAGKQIAQTVIGGLAPASRRGVEGSSATPAALRRRGAGRALLTHVVAAARARGYERLSLETGSGSAFAPAQKLYESFGFARCGPFAGYVEDPHSVFMTRPL